jgi:diacylglycerol kinase
MHKFLNSVRYALNGVRYAFATEMNIRVLLLIIIAEISAAIYLDVSTIELLLLLWIAAVLFALELVNTAIERLADRVSIQHDPQIGVVKDVMAGAVLIASLFACLIACVIFYRPVLQLFH